ncbi:hypothetical protein BDZ97DRAFT_1751972 [Flammula alnicola]|nr:hypothetical protein BDZ97DRAFT_1751972 [Flammula alnicola]
MSSPRLRANFLDLSYLTTSMTIPYYILLAGFDGHRWLARFGCCEEWRRLLWLQRLAFEYSLLNVIDAGYSGFLANCDISSRDWVITHTSLRIVCTLGTVYENVDKNSSRTTAFLTALVVNGALLFGRSWCTCHIEAKALKDMQFSDSFTPPE